MSVPPAVLAAVAAPGGGRVALVIGAGCSVESPTSLPLSRGLSEEAHRRLVVDGVIASDECADPSDLSSLADLIHAKTGSHQELVARFPLPDFESATPNEGYLIAAALLREHAISDVLTLNFDRAAGHALASVGAGSEVGVITSPASMAAALMVNVIHLHRDVRAAADDWVLRTEQIEHDWNTGWEELVTTRVVTRPVVVFVGLGTAATVLVETMKKVRGAITAEAGFHVDPDPYGTSSFTAALEIPEERFIQLGWSAFMRNLGARVAVDHVETIRNETARIENERGLQPEDHSVLLGVIEQLSLLQLGELRARWLMSNNPYLPARLSDPALLGDLVQAACVLTRQLGIGLVADREGCFQMRLEGRVIGVLVPASGGGTRDWPQLEAEARLHTATRNRSVVDRTIVLVAGVVGAREDVHAPEDLIGRQEPSVASAPHGPIFVDANELRQDPEAAVAAIS